MPTFNRVVLGHGGVPTAPLVDEAVESFLRQDPPAPQRMELIICNDTPGQRLGIDPKYQGLVRIFNVDQRFQTLSAKIQFMIEQANGDILCRWDDDDICLPHRLRYSLGKLSERLEWRSENYFYNPGHLREVAGPGNTHITALWRREVLEKIGGGYPAGLSGIEDQAFNARLREAGVSASGEVIPADEIFYLYRWGVSGTHLSGKSSGGANPHQAHYDEIGQRPIVQASCSIRPHWKRNYVAQVEQYLARPGEPKDPLSIANYCDYAGFYDQVIPQIPSGGRLVEVGCLSGASLCYLANAARDAERRLEVFGVDLGVGVNPSDRKPDYVDTHGLLENLRSTGCQDMVTLIADESTHAARLFADGSLDFVFLDAGHDYGSVRSDLQAWWPKIKPGGILAGHDYIGLGFPAVARAVDGFFDAPHESLAVPGFPSCWQRRKG